MHIILFMTVGILAITAATDAIEQHYFKVYTGKQANNIVGTYTDYTASRCAAKCFPGPPNHCVTATFNRQTRVCQISTEDVFYASDVTGVHVVTIGYKADCGVPPTVANGTFNYTQTTAGAKANLTCDLHFEPNLATNLSIVCGTDGVWSTSTNSCVASGPKFTYITGFLPTTLNSEGNLTVSIASRTAAENTQVTVDIPYLNFLSTIAIPLGSYTITITSSFAATEINDYSTKTVLVTTDRPVSVFVVTAEAETAGGALVLPETWLSSNYLLISHNAFSHSLIIGTVDNTIVSIQNTTHVSNITINRMQTYRYCSVGDVSGVAVTASENIVVQAGHKCAHVPDPGVETCDFILEQMPPEESLETEYILGYMYPRLHFSVKVVASFDQTSFYIFDKTGGLLHGPLLLNRSGVFSTIFTNGEIISIVSNLPILVAQFGHGSIHDGLGDPSMMIIPGLKQYETGYYFRVPDQFDNSTVMVICDSTYDIWGLRHNSVPLTVNPIAVTVPGWGEFSLIHILDVRHGPNVLEHIDGNVTFGALLYGSSPTSEYAMALGGLG